MYDEAIQYARRHWEHELLPEHAGYVQELRELARRKCIVGMIGLQSSGKSSFLNGLLGYPVIPSLVTRGTTCPLAVEYAPSPSLSVYYGASEENEHITLSGVFSETLFRKLLEYACHCVNQFIFYPENLGYFLSDENRLGSLTPDDIQLDRHNPRHGLVLALIALNASFAAESVGYQTPELRIASKTRMELLRSMGILGERVVLLRLQWDSESLPPGTRFLDLPGFGSDDMRNVGTFSLTGLAISWAKHCDILLCMMTGEIVGEPLISAFTQICTNVDEYEVPKVALVINKAESIQDLEIVRNAAKRIAFPSKSSLYFLSAATAEYRFTQEGIPIDHTHFWRHDFLPLLRSFSSDLQISEALRTQAKEALYRRYLKAYICEREDGSRFSISLHDVFQDEIERLTLCRSRQLFMQTSQRYPDAAARLAELSARELRLMKNIRELSVRLWGLWCSEVNTALEEWDAALASVETGLSAWLPAFKERVEAYSHYRDSIIAKTNASFSQVLLNLCDEFKSFFGFIRCIALDSEHAEYMTENDAVVRKLYAAASAFNIPFELSPALLEREAIICDGEQRSQQAVTLVTNAENCFALYTDAIPEKCCKHAGIPDSENTQFNCYILSLLQEISELFKTDLLQEMLPNFTYRVLSDSLQEMDWKTLQSDWVNRAFQSAVVLHGGRQWTILRKKRLLNALKSPFIDTPLACLKVCGPEQEEFSELPQQILRLIGGQRQKLTCARENFVSNYLGSFKLLIKKYEQILSQDYNLLLALQYAKPNI